MPDQRSYLWRRPCSVPISVTLSLDIPRGVWLRKPEEGDKLKWSRFPETRITSSRWRWLGRCPVPMLWIVAVKGRVLWSSSTNQMPRLSPLLQWAAITGCSLVGVWPEAGRGMLGMFPTPAAPPQPTILNISLLSRPGRVFTLVFMSCASPAPASDGGMRSKSDNRGTRVKSKLI